MDFVVVRGGNAPWSCIITNYGEPSWRIMPHGDTRWLFVGHEIVRSSFVLLEISSESSHMQAAAARTSVILKWASKCPGVTIFVVLPS